MITINMNNKETCVMLGLYYIPITVAVIFYTSRNSMQSLLLANLNRVVDTA